MPTISSVRAPAPPWNERRLVVRELERLPDRALTPPPVLRASTGGGRERPGGARARTPRRLTSSPRTWTPCGGVTFDPERASESLSLEAPSLPAISAGGSTHTLRREAGGIGAAIAPGLEVCRCA